MRIDLSLPTMFQTADLAALVLLFVSWFAIGWVTEHPPAGRPSVSILMADAGFPSVSIKNQVSFWVKTPRDVPLGILKSRIYFL